MKRKNEKKLLVGNFRSTKVLRRGLFCTHEIKDFNSYGTRQLRTRQPRITISQLNKTEKGSHT